VGAVKGLVETLLSSHLGPFAFAVSLIEGIAADFVFVALRRRSRLASYVAGGFSAASNLVVVRIFFLACCSLWS